MEALIYVVSKSTWAIDQEYVSCYQLKNFNSDVQSVEVERDSVRDQFHTN